MQTEIYPDPDLDLITPSPLEQVLIIGLTDALMEVLSTFPPQVASGATVTVTLQRFVIGPIEERRARLADMRMLVRLLEAVGDAEGDEAWQRVRQVLPKNTFNQDHPAGVTVQ